MWRLTLCLAALVAFAHPGEADARGRVKAPAPLGTADEPPVSDGYRWAVVQAGESSPQRSTAVTILDFVRGKQRSVFTEAGCNVSRMVYRGPALLSGCVSGLFLLYPRSGKLVRFGPATAAPPSDMGQQWTVARGPCEYSPCYDYINWHSGAMARVFAGSDQLPHRDLDDPDLRQLPGNQISGGRQRVGGNQLYLDDDFRLILAQGTRRRVLAERLSVRSFGLSATAAVWTTDTTVEAYLIKSRSHLVRRIPPKDPFGFPVAVPLLNGMLVATPTTPYYGQKVPFGLRFRRFASRLH